MIKAAYDKNGFSMHDISDEDIVEVMNAPVIAKRSVSI